MLNQGIHFGALLGFGSRRTTASGDRHPSPVRDNLEGHSGRACSLVLHPSRCQQGNLIFTHLLNVQDAGVSTRPVYLKAAFPELG